MTAFEPVVDCPDCTSTLCEMHARAWRDWPGNDDLPPGNHASWDAHDRQDDLYVQGIYDDIEPRDGDL